MNEVCAHLERKDRAGKCCPRHTVSTSPSLVTRSFLASSLLAWHQWHVITSTTSTAAIPTSCTDNILLLGPDLGPVREFSDIRHLKHAGKWEERSFNNP